MLHLLSHVLNVDTPAFAAGPSLTITPIKEVESGGSSSSYVVQFHTNHLGTHIDAPKHFDKNGKSISEYSISDLVFVKPCILDIAKSDSELITADELRKHHTKIRNSDIVLIRTGFERFRESNPVRYSTLNPGISPEACKLIVEEFPRLRCIGLDSISVSAVQRREEGRRAHTILLSGRDFFIVEDMHLSGCPNNLSKVTVVPLFVRGIDSSPCTVIAETRNMT